MMTKVERIIEQEKIDAVNEAVKAERVKANQEVAKANLEVAKVKQEAAQATERIAINMYNAGDSIEKISECVGISLTRLEEIFAPLKA